MKRSTQSATATILDAEAVECGYGSISVVKDLNLSVNRGEVVVLLGPNGVGKTTTLLTLSGDLPVLGGRVRWFGVETTKPLDARARDGLALVPEERSIVTSLTAGENLRLGRGDVDFALDLFPELRAVLKTKGGLLSGGEQQMLTLARALSRRPDLLVADELSLGLAPLVVTRLFRAIRDAASDGIGVLLVEQHVRKVLPYADRAYVMTRGRIALDGTAAEIERRIDEIESTYLATSAG